MTGRLLARLRAWWRRHTTDDPYDLDLDRLRPSGNVRVIRRR